MTATGGGIYKWTDDEGNVHYSSSPPPDQQAETVKPPPATDSEAAQKSLQKSRDILQPPEEKNKDSEKKKAAAEAEPDPAAKKKRCEAARKALEQLRTANRLQYINEDGERAYMTPEQRAEREKKAQEMVEKNCQ